jgi:uncharacterized protein
MGALRDRLTWDEGRGALADGPRRYLMMRPDVLMGAVAALDGSARVAWLQAWADSTARHGAASLKAYAEAVAFDADALMAATVQAAADLGWGAWQLARHGHELHLTVTGSPFVDGWHAACPEAASIAVCAPVRGMLQALAGYMLPGRPLAVVELDCAATHARPGPAACRFIARAADAGAA